jgi:hypothetical protein
MEIAARRPNHLRMTASEHQHGPGCGHTAVQHEGHTDYLQAGHLHHGQGDGVQEHVIGVSITNPDGHTGPAGGHAGEHRHGGGCGHESVPHGDHHDFLVEGRLHHQHGDHCDDHGPLQVV